VNRRDRSGRPDSAREAPLETTMLSALSGQPERFPPKQRKKRKSFGRIMDATV
jgi:hypothetical protein